MSFDDLMSHMGVRKLPGERSRPGGARREPPAQQKAPPRAPAPPAPPVAEEPPPAPVAVVSEPTPAAAPAAPEPPVPTPPSELTLLREQLQDAQDRALGLEAQLDALRAQRVAPVGDQPSLSQVLSERGLLGADESGRLLSALSEARLAGDLLDLLRPADVRSLSAFLHDKVALLCGAETCVAPPGRAVVVVPAGRCEVCGGTDVRSAVRRFVDGFLVNGYVEGVLVGGGSLAHRQIRDIIDHQALRLRFIPGGDAALAASLFSASDGPDVVICWCPAQTSGREPSGSDPVPPRRLVRVDQPTIAGMLKQAGDLLLR